MPTAETMSAKDRDMGFGEKVSSESRDRLLNRDVPCRNCHKSVCPRGTNECLDVSVEEVFDAACSLYEEQRLRAAA